MTDVTELFMRDPLSLTNDDITKIVEVFREKRHLFLANPGTKPAAAPKLTAKQEAANRLSVNIEI